MSRLLEGLQWAEKFTGEKLTGGKINTVGIMPNGLKSAVQLKNVRDISSAENAAKSAESVLLSSKDKINDDRQENSSFPISVTAALKLQAYFTGDAIPVATTATISTVPSVES